MSFNTSDPAAPVLNPNTPLAYLPPDIASQTQASAYLDVATFGAFAWDVLSSLHQEYRLLEKRQFTLPILAYFISRITTLAFIITCIVFQVGTTVGSCQDLQIAFGIAYILALGSSSFLFFLRARAVFKGVSPWVTRAFFALWVANVGAAIVVPFAIGGVHLANTSSCEDTQVKSFASAPLVTSTVHDTIIFIAISWHLRLLTRTDQPNLKGGLRAFFAGEGLPRFTRALLQSGQQYYFITVGGNILAAVLILTPSVPPVIRAMFTLPSIALENAMACRVFRNIKLGLFQQDETSLQVNQYLSSSIPYEGPARRRTAPVMFDREVYDIGIHFRTLNTVTDRLDEELESKIAHSLASRSTANGTLASYCQSGLPPLQPSHVDGYEENKLSV